MSVAVLAKFKNMAEFDAWHEVANAACGYPNETTDALTYPIVSGSKVYAPIPDLCPPDVLPSSLLDVGSVDFGKESTPVVEKPLAPADLQEFTEKAQEVAQAIAAEDSPDANINAG